MSHISYMLRRLFRAKGTSIIVILTLALGAGINVAVFSLIQSLLLTSVGVPHPERLIQYTFGSGSDPTFFSGPAYTALQARGIVKDVLAWKVDQFRIQSAGGVANITGALVSGNSSQILQIRPFMGSLLSTEQDRPDGGKNGWTAVLGYECWQQHFGGNKNVIGEKIIVDGAPVTIIGVLSEHFKGLMPPISPQILLPRHFIAEMYTPRDRIESPNYQEWLVFSRLPAGISLQSVRANLQAIEPQVQKAADPSSNIFAIEGKPLLSAQSGEAGSTNVVQMVRVGLLAMEALALTLYMVCCCNLFLLFKSRARQELHANAIRIALGAKRIESYRLILWESLLLSFVGSVLIVPIGWISGHVISHIVEAVPGFESFSSVSPHPLSVVEVAAMSLITTIMCGLTAQFFTKGNKFASLSGGSRIVSKKSSAWIIGIEVVASLVLTTLTCVELLGFERNLHRDSGFASSAVVATLDLNGLGSGKVTQIIDKLQTLPGISSVATMNIAPLSGATSSNELLARRAGGAVIHKRGIWEADVSPRYFTTIGTFIVKGRGFLNGDSGGDPVCVLSRAAAATFFGGGNPIDRHIYGYDPRQPMDISHNYCRIIGVAVNAHLQSMGDDPVPTVYTLSKENGPVIIVRGENSRIASDAVRTAVMAVAPTVLTDGISSIHDLIGSSLHVNKILVLFAGICTAITAAILSVGVFGILAIQVSERRREIAIRIALGADKSAVRLSILKGLRVPILIGIFLGSLISVPSAMALANSFSLSLAVVMCIYLASVFVLLGIVFAAAAIPTWRALAVPPTECLLAE